MLSKTGSMSSCLNMEEFNVNNHDDSMGVSILVTCRLQWDLHFEQVAETCITTCFCNRSISPRSIIVCLLFVAREIMVVMDLWLHVICITLDINHLFVIQSALLSLSTMGWWLRYKMGNVVGVIYYLLVCFCFWHVYFTLWFCSLNHCPSLSCLLRTCLRTCPMNLIYWLMQFLGSPSTVYPLSFSSICFFPK